MTKPLKIADNLKTGADHPLFYYLQSGQGGFKSVDLLVFFSGRLAVTEFSVS